MPFAVSCMSFRLRVASAMTLFASSIGRPSSRFCDTTFIVRWYCSSAFFSAAVVGLIEASSLSYSRAVLLMLCAPLVITIAPLLPASAKARIFSIVRSNVPCMFCWTRAIAFMAVTYSAEPSLAPRESIMTSVTTI